MCVGRVGAQVVLDVVGANIWYSTVCLWCCTYFSAGASADPASSVASAAGVASAVAAQSGACGCGRGAVARALASKLWRGARSRTTLRQLGAETWYCTTVARSWCKVAAVLVASGVAQYPCNAHVMVIFCAQMRGLDVSLLKKRGSTREAQP